MTLALKDTHIADAQANLIAQFRRRTDLDFFIASYVQELTDLEVVLFDVLLKTLTLGNTTGANLDVIGVVVGEARQGRNDTDYELAISIRILLNISSATREEIITIVRAMIGAGPTLVTRVAYDVGDPAEFDITIDDPLTVEGFDVAAFLQLAKAVGVRAIFRWFIASSGTEFRFGATGQGFDQGFLAEAV